MSFAAETVWACAAAAHRINNGYLKEDVWMMNAVPPYLDKTANKSLVKAWLRTTNYSHLTEEDYTKGREYRDHFKGYTFLAIQGQLNQFQSQAFKIATMDEFTTRSMLEFAIISCLPSVAERDQDRTALKKEVYGSTQLDSPEGSTIITELRVISSKFSSTYNKWRTHGCINNESYVDFWATDEFVPGTDQKIKAKVKQHRGDKTTALNYVKKV
jgi:hypothetical protein